MSKYQAYPEYKDSGVEWLRSIPSHWEAKPLKFICTYNDEVIADSTRQDVELEYVDIGSVSVLSGISHVETIIFGEAPSRARRIVRDGDVIVSTVRTYLDDQLQETIYQFEHKDGVVVRINHKEGNGSKSEKLAAALKTSQPIIIVTIQTFPFVIKAIENSTSLKERRYAVIADEAHSSQTGTTAGKLKEVLMKEEAGEIEPSSEDTINAMVAARSGSSNLSYYAFTATPKPKTIELFGRLPNPDLPASKQNKPEAYHIYSMRQAIEEGFILDVLKNYTNYKCSGQEL
ncbi:hypothetical protein SAMN05421784_12059 [Xenorhabdus koppenhoeferi]|uniref:SWI2/SNF2 ATPase domain-containing protein n=1 Tax=Xenorhabdus koppenhoeferi TaxID=351659 RepID=A0A1I7IGC0_9GAMM|nr:hypothetical protein SAMN05421784_12059 [Xenorhabdus koppenhoeferi]